MSESIPSTTGPKAVAVPGLPQTGTVDTRKNIRTIFFMWAVWVFAVIGFQWFSTTRVSPMPPDTAQNWTAGETMPGSQDRKIYLNEPFLNNQVSWDSEFYLSIAVTGYDDTRVFNAPTPAGIIPLNYAFFPFYPMVMRVLSLPMQWFGMTPIAAAALAGVIVSVLGALAATIALYFLTRPKPGEQQGIRAALYLLIFPTGFFLAQVYTEGLFAGLAFGCMALARSGRMWQAAILAMCAVMTRAVGVALIIPLALAWWKAFDRHTFSFKDPKAIVRTLAVLAPIAAYGLWRIILGEKFSHIEEFYFGRSLLNIGASVFGYGGWLEVLGSFWGNNGHMAAHNIIVLCTSVFAVVACFMTLKEHRDLALFGLAAFAIAAFSGSAQSMARYVLIIPSMYVLLARWGERPAFDRGWTIVSSILMGFLSMLFAFNFWVA